MELSAKLGKHSTNNSILNAFMWLATWYNVKYPSSVAEREYVQAYGLCCYHRCVSSFYAPHYYWPIMDSGVHALPQYWNCAGLPYYQPPYPVQNAQVSPLETRILYSEHDLLENNLANCVTYLQALRKKQERNVGRLSTDVTTPRKKRKQIQHSNRELNREILLREQEQHILLNNLQACKAKLYVAESLSSPSTGFLSSVPAFTSGSTRCTVPEESVPTEISWNGWTDDAVLSPFAKRSNNPFFVTEIAPEDGHEKSVEEVDPIDIEPRDPLATLGQGLGITIPSAYPEAIPLQALLSVLSPIAEVFEPRPIFRVQGVDSAEQLVELPHSSKLLALRHSEEAQRRRATDSGTGPKYQPVSLQIKSSSRLARNHTWCQNTPQVSPAKDVQGRLLITMERTNSM
ncbi:hypothetical protein T440DRAFT_511536 [Plenodomus tracheiphilus IPT5]|uniref:Uncharacterized protein n=1 Tax=Plenodomus tracheiphilus IPT5 TaxID=1408161 RepID=A0A6A7AQV3_9PLEO|nr:hypothetical protein T440DRAFT_511536 [Plenodomus tracheiphilus IPT5]